MKRQYALIDGALVYEALCESPLFTDPLLYWYTALLPGENRRLAGPILIDLDLLAAEGEETQSAVNEILNGFPGRLHVSQLQSELDLSALADHLKRFTCFYNEDDLLLLRYADTRILAHLPQALTPQQWCEMTAPILQWAFFDRSGEEVALALPEDHANVVPENKPFSLSVNQIDILTDAAEPDMLLALLDYTPQMMESRLHEYWDMALQCIETWKKSGSGNREVLKQFSVKVFNSNGQVIQDRDWVTMLAKATPQEILDL